MAKPVDPAAGATLNYQWMKPAVASSPDVWGSDLNWDLDQIDSTMWSVSSAQSSYLPLTGGTLTGQVNGTLGTFTGQFSASILIATGGNVVSRATGASNASFVCQNNASANVGYFFWNPSGQVGMQQIASGGLAYVDSGGIFNTNGPINAGTGYFSRAGTAGVAAGQLFNFNWTGTALQAWVNTTNLGTIAFTSDYRVKKDVAELPSMWETVKALNPISYTHKDYTPPAELERDADAQPLVVGDDIEQWGFIAHELQETLIPSAASGVKDQADCIQSPNVWTVIATLTKALQEAMARIEALEAA